MRTSQLLVRRLCATAIGLNLFGAALALPAVRGADAAVSVPLAAPVAAASPVRIVIPSVGIDAPIVAVGKQPDGQMEMPSFGSAGWYELGPRPGERGPSVIAAHFDSYTGPDVFYRLRQLKAGDRIDVIGSDGRTVQFVTTEQTTAAKTSLPVDRIWGPTNYAALRLVTCSGKFNRSTHHYVDNRVVFAALAS